ncbi:MFS family permease [Caulobacter ginsengisoli]|uniref:MFS family permease n=1 Tax=Caulobacter ginsengisoli TaxID=400775 RepID=A0ABU0IUW8_9CAUL|nr:MFS transporter [Caulobacter ginsengisoli]MDQ0465804.1 MFS family permease [Caulobacter ginsengisoli]
MSQSSSERAPPTWRQVAAVVAGNGLEFYDFLTFSFFAVQIGQTFFPSKDPTISLLASLATFGAGFLTRPIGAFFIGRFADRAGRRPAMLLSFSLMGFAITGIALTPSYHSIGIAAPILAVIFRLLQGFALGGEVGPSTAYLLEAAPPHRRGFYASLQYMGQDTAVLCAGLMGVLLSSILSAGDLRDFGWRIALLVGTVIVPFALILRRGIAETLVPAAPADDAGPKPRTPIPWRVVILGFAMLAAGTTANYVLDYMTTYASTTLHMATRLAFGATVAVGLAGLTCDMLGGVLSDRYGRRPVMLTFWIALLIAVGPCFWMIAHFRNLAALMTATAILSGLLNLSTSAMLTSVTESLPMQVRSGTLAIVYALAISVFGGSAQFNVAALTHLLQSELTPAFYMGGGVLIGLVAMLMMRESAPVKLGPALATSAAAP